MNSQNNNPLWLKAGIIGSVWAAFEIIAGSFIHNLQIPFAGTMLSIAATFLLVSFLQIWKEKGIIIRAGIICALLKVVSPSAIILGPMVGIFMEAFIIEIFVFLLGRNIIGYMIAGAIAVLWSLIQKILFLLILYGADLIELVRSFYEYLVKISGIQSFPPVYLISGIAMLYLVSGMIAAIGGYLSGRKKPEPDYGKEIFFKPGSIKESIFQTNPDQHFSLPLLFLIIIGVACTLFFINNKMYLQGILMGAVFIVFCIKRYRNSVRHLKKPHLWIQFLLITLVATLVWELASTGQYFSVKGLITGLEMNFRALIIVFGFAAISVELRNPLVKSILNKKGLKELHQTLSFAFATLPSIIENMPGPAKIIKNKKSVISGLLKQSQNLYLQFEKQNQT